MRKACSDVCIKEASDVPKEKLRVKNAIAPLDDLIKRVKDQKVRLASTLGQREAKKKKEAEMQSKKRKEEDEAKAAQAARDQKLEESERKKNLMLRQYHVFSYNGHGMVKVEHMELQALKDLDAEKLKDWLQTPIIILPTSQLKDELVKSEDIGTVRSAFMTEWGKSPQRAQGASGRAALLWKEAQAKALRTSVNLQTSVIRMSNAGVRMGLTSKDIASLEMPWMFGCNATMHYCGPEPGFLGTLKYSFAGSREVIFVLVPSLVLLRVCFRALSSPLKPYVDCIHRGALQHPTAKVLLRARSGSLFQSR